MTPGPLRSPRPPLPQGAADCHIHILGRPEGAVAEYRRIQSSMGFSRSVVVTPSGAEFDNSLTLDAVDELGSEVSRAVVVIHPGTEPSVLDELHSRGARAARLNLGSAGALLGAEDLAPLARLVAPLGWRVEMHAHGDYWAAQLERLLPLAEYLTIEHAGRIRGGGQEERLSAVFQLQDAGAWVKLSGLSHDSGDAPLHRDRVAIARRLMERQSDRVVWGTDWPHLAAMRGDSAYPESTALMDALFEDVSADVRQRVLVENPSSLYGF